MSPDKMSLKTKGFLWELMLQGGGAKFFLFFIAIVGVVCILFSWVTKSLLPFSLFAIIAVVTLYLLCRLVGTTEGRLFFLDSNSYVRIVKMQMALIGDKSGLKQIGPRTQFVQPIIGTPGDVITEAKEGYRRAVKVK